MRFSRYLRVYICTYTCGLGGNTTTANTFFFIAVDIFVSQLLMQLPRLFIINSLVAITIDTVFVIAFIIRYSENKFTIQLHL